MDKSDCEMMERNAVHNLVKVVGESRQFAEYRAFGQYEICAFLTQSYHCQVLESA